jgi:sterol desaturase/sphingolipid hydroxylase (fatty acid hydroxylase superfamily)
MRVMVLLAVTLIGSYYVTTLTLWFGHWFSHRASSPLRGFHVLGHHTLYPDSARVLSSAFRYASGRHDSLYALVPWLVLQQVVLFLFLPEWLFLISLLTASAILSLTTYCHLQFHVSASPLERFAWFRRARRVHATHHDDDVNFMVAHHFWDRVFGTYRDVVPAVPAHP